MIAKGVLHLGDGAHLKMFVESRLLARNADRSFTAKNTGKFALPF